MTDDSEDDDVELSLVSGPRFGTAGGHLDRDAVALICTPSCITRTQIIAIRISTVKALLSFFHFVKHILMSTIALW